MAAGGGGAGGVPRGSGLLAGSSHASMTAPSHHGSVSGGGAAPGGLSPTFTSHPLKVLRGHTRSVTGLEVLPSSGNLASCSLDGTLLVWDYVTATVLHK